MRSEERFRAFMVVFLIIQLVLLAIVGIDMGITSDIKSSEHSNINIWVAATPFGTYYTDYNVDFIENNYILFSENELSVPANKMALQYFNGDELRTLVLNLENSNIHLLFHKHTNKMYFEKIKHTTEKTGLLSGNVYSEESYVDFFVYLPEPGLMEEY